MSSDGAMPLPTPQSEGQRALLNAIAVLFAAESRWPTFAEVDYEFDHDDQHEAGLDAHNVWRSLPAELVTPPALTVAPRSLQELRLTAAGLTWAGRTELVELFLALVHLAAERRWEWRGQEEAAGPIIDHRDVTDLAGGEVAHSELVQVGLLLDVEPWGQTNGSRAGSADWHFVIGRGVREYRGISSVAQYWERRMAAITNPPLGPVPKSVEPKPESLAHRRRGEENPKGPNPEDRPLLAFISHASEDKKGFAEPLARSLFERGVTAWLDKWEMQPGDSVVKKIFDEGIAKADCFVIILSKHSIDKPWVRKELDSGMVENINGTCDLIPIKLGDVEVPAPLRSTLWINASTSADSVADAADQIVKRLSGHDPRPALGKLPAYLRRASVVAGLRSEESLLLVRLAERAIVLGYLHTTPWSELIAAVEPDGVRPPIAEEAAHVLESSGYVTVRATSGRGILRVQITDAGFAVVLPTVYPDAETLKARIVAELINDPPAGVDELAGRLEAPKLIVHQFVHDLQARGMLHCSDYLGGNSRISSISPALRRLAQGQI